MLENPL
jgi:hypothetical protein